jgi:hypothetical protein
MYGNVRLRKFAKVLTTLTEQICAVFAVGTGMQNGEMR